jgi:hypothetical protein
MVVCEPTGGLLEEPRLQLQRRLTSEFGAAPERAMQYESPTINISATQVFLAMATGLGLTGPLVWMFVRYWLFAP